MITTPTPLTGTEKALQSVLCSRREGGYAGRKPRVVAPCHDTLRHIFDDAHRGGSTYSSYARFERELQVEWAIRVLNYLTEEQVEQPRIYIHRDAPWSDVQTMVEQFFNEKFEAERVELQEGYDAEPGAFSNWSPGIVVDGKVVDPWGYNFADLCRWFIGNMSQYTVFTVWKVVYDAVEDCIAENLGDWASSGDKGDPIEVAAKAFNIAMQNLEEYIQPQLVEAA